MDKLAHYRTCIQTLLEQHSQTKTQEEVENQLVFDIDRDHYQLMRVAWKGLNRVYHTVLHFDIKDGKIWLQQNTTDIDVGQELQDMGIPKKTSFWDFTPLTNAPTPAMALPKTRCYN